MFAPPHAAVSSVFDPMEKALVSESTLSQLGFPNEFPYEFDSSPFTSPGDSTETEDETSDDEDDFFAGLTRRLALSTQRLPSPPPPPPPFFTVKTAEVSSTESTPSGLGSLKTSGNKCPNGPFSQAPSPPESAAGEVSKIKRANLDANPNSFIPIPQNAAFCGYYYWPALNAFPYRFRSVFAAPTAVKQPSAGTGVFLPKNLENPSDSRKKGGGGCVNKIQTKVVQRQHSKTETFSGRCNSRSQACLRANSNVPNLSSETQFPKLK